MGRLHWLLEKYLMLLEQTFPNLSHRETTFDMFSPQYDSQINNPVLRVFVDVDARSAEEG